jgi:hypothetical protein
MWRFSNLADSENNKNKRPSTSLKRGGKEEEKVERERERGKTAGTVF